jgi:hypothetical protein
MTRGRGRLFQVSKEAGRKLENTLLWKVIENNGEICRCVSGIQTPTSAGADISLQHREALKF